MFGESIKTWTLSISSKSDIELPRFQKREYPADEIDQLEEARRIYGPHVCYLTRHVLEQWALTAELPIKFIGLSGQSMYSPETSAERKKELTVFKCVRVPDFEDATSSTLRFFGTWSMRVLSYFRIRLGLEIMTGSACIFM